jgi:Zn-dependent M28 family amino/carboxypeptidase
LVLASAGCGGHTPSPSGPGSGAATAASTPVPVTEAAPSPAAAAPAPVPEPPIPAAPPRVPTPIADAHAAAAERIRREGASGRRAYATLAELTDRIGARPAGSKALDRAITWAADRLRADGLVVRTEKVMVDHWVRGEATGEIVSPQPSRLHLLALGHSPGTGKAGVSGEVVIVDSLEALEALGPAGVHGKIVLFNKPMITDADGTPHYGEVAPLRGRGPALAQKLGAKAALVRSLTSRSLRTPHTGGTWFGDDNKAKAVPAAAITTEDADLIARLAATGKVTVKLVLTCKTLPDAPSANVVADLPGREKPAEIVLLGAHIDSWDVGQGAHDDGAGSVIMMEAVALLKRLGLAPRRTIRVVLFTNEELGLDGAQQYVKDHAAELGNHVAAIESDTGSFAPRGFMLAGKPTAERVLAQLADIVSLLAPEDAARAIAGFGGADIGALEKAGAKTPLIGHWMDTSTYFDVHHTEADTLDKVDPDLLQKNVVVMAIFAYVLAEMPGRLGE